MNLPLSVIALGEELVNCRDKCAGISCDQSQGILPRGLIFEEGSDQRPGAMIVGMNLGRSDSTERAYYVTNGVSYASLKSYWDVGVRDLQYYAKARAFVRAVGILGAIVWSDVAKCENLADRTDPPPLQTLRHCGRRFLQRELSLLPSDWPLFALGLDAYRALAYMVPTRAVIGVPHPTGAYGPFAALWNGGAIVVDVQARIAQACDVRDPYAVWLGKVRAGV